MKFWFVRHMETEFNRKDLFSGCTDISILNPPSNKSMEALATLRATLPKKFDYYICSDLHRTSETLKHIFPDVTPVICPYIREINYGVWEGKEKSSVGKKLRKALQNGTFAPTGAEKNEEVVSRINAFFEYCQSTFPADATIFVVTHAGFMRVLTRELGVPCPKGNLSYFSYAITTQ